MAVLVTGGHGQIGSWTAWNLAKRGRDVLICDTNTRSPDYLEEVAEHIEFVPADVLDLPSLNELFARRKSGIDGIIHSVGIMGEQVLENPHRNVSLNVMGLVNVMEAARIAGIPKVLLVSTGAVYGVVPGHPKEEVKPDPADLYAATKTAGEYLGIQYGAAFGIDFRISRVYFIYGPGKMPSSFIRLYRLAFGALEGLPGLESERGADQKLDFTYVEDAARGIVLQFEAERPERQIYNIATGRASSVGEVISLATRHTACPGPEVRVGPGELMPRSEALDITNARRDLGYEPAFSLEEGIRRYADWIRRQMGG